MTGFENYEKETSEIELEIERKGIILGINWQDEVQVRALAHEALCHLADDMKIAMSNPIDRNMLAKVELFGLAALMLRTMQESAGVGIESHGGVAWKAFGKALFAEAQSRK